MSKQKNNQRSEENLYDFDRFDKKDFLKGFPMNIYPTILTDSSKIAQEQINLVKDLDKISTIQIDVIDGYFVDNVTVTPLDLVDLTFGPATVDLHLMTEEPLDYVYEFLERKDELPVRAVIGQIEKMSYQRFFLEEAKRHEWQAGLSLDLYTPLESIDDEVWSLLDVVQLVAIDIGYQGNPLKEIIFQKIKELSHYKTSDQDFEIIIDGGVKLDNVQKLIDAGADSFSVGSAIWHSRDVAQTVNEFAAIINNKKTESE